VRVKVLRRLTTQRAAAAATGDAMRFFGVLVPIDGGQAGDE